MSTFKRRLVEETNELKNKVEKLRIFTHSGNFKTVDEFQRTLYSIQLKSMETYLECLCARLLWLEQNEAWLSVDTQS
jgi:hypothetical protein